MLNLFFLIDIKKYDIRRVLFIMLLFWVGGSKTTVCILYSLCGEKYSFVPPPNHLPSPPLYSPHRFNPAMLRDEGWFRKEREVGWQDVSREGRQVLGKREGDGMA